MRTRRRNRMVTALLVAAGAGLLLAFIQPGGNADRTVSDRFAALTKRAGEYLRPPV